MPTLLPDMSVNQFQFFVKEVYGKANNRYYDISEMLDNIQRFAMRGIKGIRKGNIQKTKENLLISYSWFTSLLNRLHIEIEEELWQRFPYLCSYCNACPCSCKVTKPETRQPVVTNKEIKPKTLNEFQKMFGEVYPASTRTIEHSGIHLAEEIGELSEAIWSYRSKRSDEDFKEVKLEAADYISCLLGVFNSLNLNFAEELSRFFLNNCHNCQRAPCACTYDTVRNYKS